MRKIFLTIALLLAVIISLPHGSQAEEEPIAIAALDDFFGAGGMSDLLGGGTASEFLGKVTADYSDIVFWANAEGTWSVGTSYTLGAGECQSIGDGDNACAINSEFTEETGSPLQGASSFKIVGAYDRCSFDNTLAWTKGRIGALLYFPTGEIGYDPIFFFNNSPANLIGFTTPTVETTRAFLRDNGTYTTTVTGTVTTYDTAAVFVEVAFDFTIGAGSDRLEIYENGSLTDWDYFLTITDSMTISNFFLGTSNSSGAVVYYFDQVMVSTDPTRDLNALKALSAAPLGACP